MGLCEYTCAKFQIYKSPCGFLSTSENDSTHSQQVARYEYKLCCTFVNNEYNFVTTLLGKFSTMIFYNISALLQFLFRFSQRKNLATHLQTVRALFLIVS